MTKSTCDKCGEELSGKYPSLHSVHSAWGKSSDAVEYDICDECIPGFNDLLVCFFSQKEKPKKKGFWSRLFNW